MTAEHWAEWSATFPPGLHIGVDFVRLDHAMPGRLRCCVAELPADLPSSRRTWLEALRLDLAAWWPAVTLREEAPRLWAEAAVDPESPDSLRAALTELSGLLTGARAALLAVTSPAAEGTRILDELQPTQREEEQG